MKEREAEAAAQRPRFAAVNNIVLRGRNTGAAGRRSPRKL
jgi:hypothetical protein